MARDWISIGEVLADIEKTAEDGHLHIFSIAWVRRNNSANGRRGSIKRVPRCAKYMGPKRERKNVSSSNGWQFKLYNAIPMRDLDADQMITPLFTHIVEYNGRPVKHYGNGSD